MSTFQGFFEEFGSIIRADRFTRLPDGISVELYLLSHIHTDHLIGLSSAFHQSALKRTLICTKITKELLPKLASSYTRVCQATEILEEAKKRKPYRNVEECFNFVCLDYNQPYMFETSANKPEDYRITLIDANHCPGSCAFLIEAFNKGRYKHPKCAILYTGDIRADPDWMKMLQENPCLQPYVCRSVDKGIGKLQTIYLDTSAMFSPCEVPSKADAIQLTIGLLKQFPSDAKFFINLWTPGYEELALHIAQAFNTKIHLDRFKREQYVLFFGKEVAQMHFTSSENTRFHACEKFWKCDAVWQDGRGCYSFPLEVQAQMYLDSGYKKEKRNAGCGCRFAQASYKCQGEACEMTRSLDDEGLVVYVNPVEPFSIHKYEKYERDIRKRLERCRSASQTAMPSEDWPVNIVVPFSRHSALPELQRFVKLFRPRTLFPNTIHDLETSRDYLCLPKLLRECLSEDCGFNSTTEKAKSYAEMVIRRRNRVTASSARFQVEDLARRHAATEVIISNATLANTAGPPEIESEILDILDANLADPEQKVRRCWEDVELSAEDMCFETDIPQYTRTEPSTIVNTAETQEWQTLNRPRVIPQKRSSEWLEARDLGRKQKKQLRARLCTSV